MEQPDPLTRIERLCLSPWYWPTLAIVLAVFIGAALRMME